MLVRRLVRAIGAAAFGALVITLGTAFAQGGVPPGYPPETGLYEDAVLLARVLPFVAVLAIAFGVWRGKVSMRQPKSAPDSPVVTRHDIGTVTSHWTNGVGFILGLITGAIILRWLPHPDQVRDIFIIHYVGAALVVFGVVSHLAQNAVTGGTGLLPRSFRDLREALGELVEYAGIYGPSGAVFRIKLPKFIRDTFGETFRAFGIAPPKRMGKYLPAEKVFSYTPWAIIIGVMLITGLVKSFRYLYPIPPTLVATMTAIHDLFAAITVAMLVIHLAALLLVPRNWPLLASMFTTHVPRRYVQQWQPVWFRQLVAREQPAAPAAPPQVQVAPQAEKSRA
jgi:cytochrome b subunit of formate dehydrogenase